MSLALLKLLSMLSLFAAGYFAVSHALVRVDSLPNRLVRRYVLYLDAALYEMQLPPKGAVIAGAQATALTLTALVAAATGAKPSFLGVALVIVIAPRLWLFRKLKQRRTEIELQLNSFNIALANALRASPSLGKALKRAEDVAQGALAEELRIVLKELRLGATVDQSLLNLAARVGSVSLDAIISALLIGRQIGGRIPDILESTASTLREMERLEGVIRSKTSEAKGQLWLMGLAPGAIFLIFDSMQPGYFDVLTTSAPGLMLLAIAIMAWAASILAARKILSLEI
jgi:tight adherence protein B